MPELSNIQTIEKINGLDFKPIIERFSKVLRNVHLWNETIKDAFEKFEWNVEKNGFVYFSTEQLSPIFSKFLNIEVRPLVMAYTPEIDATFNDNWIMCELLIETEKLRNVENGEFYDTTYPFVKFLASEMQKEFTQAGIYFTDEAQDGEDFDGIRNNDLSKLWQFDYALIPLTLENVYRKKPETHYMKNSKNGFETWNMHRWKEKPNQ